MNTNTKPATKAPQGVCSFCGRRQHKVVVTFSDRTVSGYCPTCWDTDRPFGARAQVFARDPQAQAFDRREAR